ncbi:MAG: iron-sulfur binding protein [Hyphomicrobiales bacterium]|nr:iron-sulfur binding protein [Hyphomicrobiales bacterium]
MTKIALHVNGAPIQSDVEPRTSLADFVRETCGLTATHLGCEHGACGACTVLVDGVIARSCLKFAVMCDGRNVVTLEGLADDPLTDVLRQAFHESHALQCGFCTPGMLMAGRDLLRRNPTPSEDEVRQALAGHICRCTGYSGIVHAIKLASTRLTPAECTSQA